VADWIYGRNAVYECLRAGRRAFKQLWLAEGLQPDKRLDEVISLARQHQLNPKPVKKPELNRVGESHQGVALQVGDYVYSELNAMLGLARKRNEAPFLLLLDTLQDPQNLGTLLRTAEVVGVHGVVLPHRRTATVTPAVVNASSGASEHLLISQANLAQTIDQLKAANVWVVGLDAGANAQPPDRVRLDGAIALVVGSEGEGMRRLVRESCDLLLRLPMRGQVASLNAAVAGSIALFLAAQARKSD
jgi:23S rRNA (guanosine2251-2'-O)-methyltransferase